MTVAPSDAQYTVAGTLDPLSGRTCSAARTAAWGWEPATNLLSLSLNPTDSDAALCTDATCSEPASRLHAGDISMAIAGRHSCTIRAFDGTVWCSGAGESGQLGNGATDDHLTPVKVMLNATNPLAGVKTIAAGGGGGNDADGHTCACTASGEAYCWGRRDSGQLGIGAPVTPDTATMPVTRPTLVLLVDGSPLAGCVGVTTSATHTCFVTSAADGGELYCTGRNTDGQLGQGTADTLVHETAQLVEPVNFGSAKVVAASAGDKFTCAVLDTGRVRCVGASTSGQLGLGVTQGSYQTDWAEAIGVTDAAAVVTGDDHACALTTGGKVSCWGRWKAVGADDAGVQSVPLEVVGSGATHVAAGLFHTCALLSNSQVMCWGRGANGRLGTGSHIDTDIPTSAPVLSNLAPLTLAAGGFSTCVIDGAGARHCVGSNAQGQLGNDGYSSTNLQAVTTIADLDGGASVWGAPVPFIVVKSSASDAACSLNLVLEVKPIATCEACDKNAPTISIALNTTTPISAGPQNTALVNISVTAADDFPSGTTFNCTNATDGAQIATGPAGTITFLINLPEGQSTITCAATDCGDRQSESVTLTVFVTALEAGATPCEPGHGGEGCPLCIKGTWSAGGNVIDPEPECQACTFPLTTAGLGAFSLDNCTVCRPGRGGSTCRACAAGTWSFGGTGDDPKKLCTPCYGTAFTTVYQGTNDPNKCTACRAGHGSTNGGTNCDPCGPGKFSAGGTVATQTPECSLCPVGTHHTFQTAASSLSCTYCKPGYGGSTCAICPKGQYGIGFSTTRSKEPCRLCASGYQALTAGCSVCEPISGRKLLL
ncbi:MAG: regulator of chromosome condensation 1/beta-lactamase-inhibitor protein II [Monoraphidium minutum]|nr:MAG: regulator of chromosome condensation 1/beta-lactamase-inhibitor protein II [Monoraphidium minutum]